MAKTLPDGLELGHESTEAWDLAQQMLDAWAMRDLALMPNDIFVQAIAFALGAFVKGIFPAHLTGFIVDDLQHKILSGSKQAVQVEPGKS